jgi:hypothetical protein
MPTLSRLNRRDEFAIECLGTFLGVAGGVIFGRIYGTDIGMGMAMDDRVE